MGDTTRALNLRVAGVGFDVIAEKCGFGSVDEARAAVRTALVAEAGVDAAAEGLTDLARLDRLLVGVWRDAVAGDEGKVRVALKIIERRGVLLENIAGAAPATSGGGATPLDELERRRAGRGAVAARTRGGKVAVE